VRNKTERESLEDLPPVGTSLAARVQAHNSTKAFPTQGEFSVVDTIFRRT
jgi:hypothetical protein